MSRSRRVRVRKLLNSQDEVVDPRAVGAVLPLAVVADAVDFVVEADSTAHSYVGLQFFAEKKKETNQFRVQEEWLALFFCKTRLF